MGRDFKPETVKTVADTSVQKVLPKQSGSPAGDRYTVYQHRYGRRLAAAVG